MGSKSTATQSPTFSSKTETTTPWAPQGSGLTTAFDAATQQYKDMQADPYTGGYAAQPTAQQYDAYGQLISGADAARPAVEGMLPQGQAIAGAGWDSAQSALGGFGSFTKGDPVGDQISSAQRYMQGADIPGQVQASMRSANRNASENDIPNLYRSAAGSGNINSDRTAISQGIVERGLAEKSADLTAQLSNANYTNGLSLSQNNSAQLLQALGLQGTQGQTLGKAGIDEIIAAIGAQGDLGSQQVAGANGAQGLDQAALTAKLQEYLGPYQLDAQSLQSLMGIVGSGNWGGTKTTTGFDSGGTSTAQTTPSVGSMIAGGLGTVGSLIKK